MDKPKVSVIIPVYNVEAYLEQCIESVRDQTLEDIEIIPVDDGSPDDCGKIIDEYAAYDSRIRPIHQQNGGYGKAVNAGITAATGEYIAIVESDDWVEPDMLQVLYDAAMKTKSKVVKGTFRKVYRDKTSHEFSLEYVSGGVDGFVSPAESLEFMICESSIWSAIYHREFLLENNILMIETPGAGYQDVVWKFMVYSSCDTVYIINKAVYNYRVFAVGSSSASKDKAHAMFHNYSVIRDYLDSRKIFGVFKESYFVHQIFDCVFHVNRLSKEGRKYFYREAREMIRDAETNGVKIAKITFSKGVEDYVSKHVLPLYTAIKDQKLYAAEVKLRGRRVLRKLVGSAMSMKRNIGRITGSLRS